jgi:hypothetical protein
MRGWLGLALSLGLVGWAPVALAGAPPVSLVLEECPDLSRSEVERIFSAELGSSTTDQTSPNVTDVTIICEGARVVVRVKDPLSRKTVQRSFDTSSFDERATPRLVALAASELVLASWAELYSNPLPQVEPEGAPPSSGEAKAVLDVLKEKKVVHDDEKRTSIRRAEQSDEPDERVLRLVALGSIRGFPAEEDSVLGGGGLRLGEERFRLVAWSLDSFFEGGDVVGKQGSQSVTEHVVSWTVGGALLAYYRWKPLTFRLGVGLRAGVVSAEKTAVAPWGWPLGTTIWTLRFGSFVMDVSGEAGYVVFPLAEGAMVRGYWLSAQGGFGMVL